MAVTLEELEIFLGVTDNLQSAYQRVDQFAAKTEARFKSVQNTMDRALGGNRNELLLTYKVDDRALTAANKHLESKRTHLKEVQRWIDQNPLTYKADMSAIKAARAEIAGLHRDMRNLGSSLNQQGRITVEYHINASSFIDEFEKAGDRIAEKIGKTTVRTSGGGFGGLLSIPGAIIQGVGIQIGQRISSGFSKASESSLEAFGRGIDKQFNRAIQTLTVGLARAGGYSTARDFRRDATQTIDNLTNFSPRRVAKAVKKLEDDLVDVLESAVVDNDPAAVQAKLRRIQREMLEQPIEAARNTAGAAIRIAAQPFRIRKRVELHRTVQEAEGMVDEILQSMSDELKDQIKKAKGVTIATGGIDYQQGGENAFFSANLVRKLTPGNVTIPVPNAFSNDPSTLGALFQARQSVFPGKPMPLDRMLQTSVEMGRNPDAARMLAQAMAVRRIAPDAPITFTGSSGGAALVEEVIGAAERAAIKKVKGVGLTMPGFDLTRTASTRNFQTLVGSYDPVAIGAFGNRFNDQSRYFGKAMGAAPFDPTGLLSPGRSTSVFTGLGTGHHLADFLSDPNVQQKFRSFTGTGSIDPGYTGDRKNFGFANQLYSESQAIPRTLGVILGDLKALSEVAKGEYSFIDPGHPDWRRDNEFQATIGNFERLKVTGADAPEYERFLDWLKTFKRELTAFYEMAGTHEGMMPKGLTDAAKQGQEFFKFREGVYQPEFVAQDPLNLPIKTPKTTEKVLEVAGGAVEKLNQGLSALAPVGEAATNVVNDVAQSLLNLAGNQVQKRVDQLRADNPESALTVRGQGSRPGTMTEFGMIAAQDLEKTRQGALKVTEQFVKLADGTIKTGKALRDFIQGLRSQGRTIQDLGDAVVEVSAELVNEFGELGGSSAADIKLLTASMAALKGEIDSLPPLLPSAEINESEKKTQELVQTAYNLYEVWDKLSKESESISLTQGGVFDIPTLQKSLDIIQEIERTLAEARYVTGQTYDQGYDGLIAQIRSVQEPLGRLKGGAYRGIRDNLSQVREAAIAGDDTAQGFIDGIEGKLNAIESVANVAGKKLILEMKSILGIASPSKVFIQIGKDVVAGFEIGLEDLDDVWMRAYKALENLNVPNAGLLADGVEDTIRAQVRAGNQNIRVDQFGKLLEDEVPKVQKTSREIGFEIGTKTREGIDRTIPVVSGAISALTDSILDQLRVVAPGITGFIEGIGLDLNQLKSLGGAGLTLGAVAVGVGLFGGRILEVANNTADAASEQNRFKRALDQTVAGGGAAYYGRLAAEANKYGVNLQAAARAAVSLETSLVNRPLAGQGIEILSGFQAQFAAQGTPVEDQQRALVGVEQAIRKGKLQAEELYQIIEPLPGAMEALAAATGKTTAELFRATSQGEVFTEDIIQQFSNQLKIQSGMADGANTAGASMGRLQNQTAILSANVGQLSVVARKAGTDLLGMGLEEINKNAETFNVTLLLLTGTMGVGVVSATVSAAKQIMGLAAAQKLAAASSATLSAGLAATTKAFLPLAALAMTYQYFKFEWDLRQPSDRVKKLTEDSDRLLRKIREINGTDPERGGRTRSDAEEFRDIISGRSDKTSVQFFDELNKRDQERRKAENDLLENYKNLDRFASMRIETENFVDSLKKGSDELEKINKLQQQVAERRGLAAVETNRGNTPRVQDLNREITRIQREINSSPTGKQINEFAGNLTGQIKALDSTIQDLENSDILSTEAQYQLEQFKEAREDAQNLYNELQKINGISLQPLQEINASTRAAVLNAQRELENAQAVTQRNRAEMIRQLGGPGAADAQALAVESARFKLTDLKSSAEALSKQLEAQNKGIKDAAAKLKPQALEDFRQALTSLGVTMETATSAQFDEAIAILSAGGKDPSGTVKKFTEEQLKARRATREQLTQNTAEIAQAEQDIRRSELDKHNAAIDYARQVQQSNFELQKSIEDNQRQLRRQFQDTIQETRQLLNDIARIRLRNELQGQIQTISGDFSDSVLQSMQSFFDKIAEAMDAKLQADGITQSLNNRIEDVILGQRDFQLGIFNQQQSMADAAAAQAGVGKSYQSFMSSLGPVTLPHVQNYGVSRRGGRLHAGQDYDISGNQNVYAGVSGTVTKVGYDPGGYGHYIDIFNNQLKVVERIAEAATVLVRLGDKIRPGQLVGRGESETGVIHREIRKDINALGQGGYGFGGTIDPREFYRKYAPKLFNQASSVGTAAKPAGSSRVVMTDTGKVDANGLKLFKVDVIDANGNVTFSTGAYSGGVGAQTLQTAAQGIPGSKKPIPEGRYSIGPYETGNFGSVGDRWMGLESLVGGRRGAFGFHADVDGIAGSEGCIVFTDPATVKRLADAVQRSGAKELFVDYGLGTIARQTRQQIATTNKSLGTMQASWYGPGFHGRQAADGSIFDQNAMTVAHKTLPFGTMLRIIGQAGEAIAKVTDRGPFIAGRDIDLSKAVAQKVGILDSGTGAVKVEIVNPGAVTGGVPQMGASPDVVGAIQQQIPLQGELAALKEQAARLDSSKILRDTINQIVNKASELRQEQIGLRGQVAQRSFDQLPQSPLLGVLSQLTAKQVADAQAIEQSVLKSATFQREIESFTQQIAQFEQKVAGLPSDSQGQYQKFIENLKSLRKEYAFAKTEVDAYLRSIEQTNPIKVFERNLRTATDAQLQQTDSLMGQLDAINALSNLSGNRSTGSAARAVAAQFRAAREAFAAFNESTDATLTEFEKAAIAMDSAGNKNVATALRKSAEIVRESAKAAKEGGDSLSENAEKIATANASLDEAFKRSVDSRRFLDQRITATQNLGDRQAQLLDFAGDTFGANDIRRRLEIDRERKQLTDEIKANELEINKLTNLGTPDDLLNADRLFATNDAIREQIELLEQLANISYPSVASSMRVSIADAGSQAFGALASAIAEGNINIQSLSDIFKQAGQTIIQTIIEIGQQFIKSQIFNLLGGILGIGSGPQLTGGGINAALPLIFNQGGRIPPNFARGEGYTLPSIASAMERERIMSGGREPRLVVANTDERILNPSETKLWETITKYGFRNENYAMGGSVGGGSTDGSNLVASSGKVISLGNFVFNGGGNLTAEDAATIRKEVITLVDRRTTEIEIQRRRSGR